MRDQLVSIIIPIYKTEEYLRKCINSVLSQTYGHIEVILVNDGSPDHSLDICKKYASEDSRIVVVDKKNGGLSSARNAGLDVCKGEFITFLDSDDYLDETVVQSLIDTITAENADISYIDEVVVDEDGQIIGYNERKHTKKMYDANQFLRIMCERRINCSVCGKLFRAMLFQNIRFNEQRLNEDFLIMSEMLMGSNKVIVEDAFCGYYYLNRINSISRHGFGKSSKDAVYNTQEMKKLAEVKDHSLVPYYGAYAAYQARTALIIMTSVQRRDEKEFVQYCRFVIDANMQYLTDSFVPRKDRWFCRLFLVAPQLSYLVIRLVRGKK